MEITRLVQICSAGQNEKSIAHVQHTQEGDQALWGGGEKGGRRQEKRQLETRTPKRDHRCVRCQNDRRPQAPRAPTPGGGCSIHDTCAHPLKALSASWPSPGPAHAKAQAHARPQPKAIPRRGRPAPPTMGVQESRLSEKAVLRKFGGEFLKKLGLGHDLKQFWGNISYFCLPRDLGRNAFSSKKKPK